MYKQRVFNNQLQRSETDTLLQVKFITKAVSVTDMCDGSIHLSVCGRTRWHTNSMYWNKMGHISTGTMWLYKNIKK